MNIVGAPSKMMLQQGPLAKRRDLPNGGGDLAQLLGNLHSNDNLSELDIEFLKRARSLAHVNRIHRSDLPRLASAFAAAVWPEETVPNDAYYFSPTYLSLTGRRGGLWEYNRSFTLDSGKEVYVHFYFCLHPNKKDSILIFPPAGYRTRRHLSQFINNFSDLKGLDIRIARVSEAHDALTHLRYPPDSTSGPQSMRVINVEEDILDWRYPVVTFSAQDLMNANGSAYAKIRQTRSKFELLIENGIVRVDDLNFSSANDIARISTIAGAWTSAVQDKYGENNTGMPDDYFTRLADLGQSYNGGHNGLALRASILTAQNKDLTFVIWEPPVFKQGRTACIFASQTLDSSRNVTFTHPLSGEENKISNSLMYMIDYVTKQAAMNTDNPADFVCLGGSEDEAQHKYKTQFGPVPERSPQLRTLQVDFFDPAPS